MYTVEVLKWIADKIGPHGPEIVAAIIIQLAVSVLNAKTLHWTNRKTKTGKALGFISEVLSILRSKDAQKRLKLPLMDGGKDEQPAS